MIRAVLTRSGIFFALQMLGKLVGVAAFIYLARALSVEAFGQVLLFVTLTSFTTVLADFGLPQWYHAHENHQGIHWFSRMLQARLITLILSIFVLATFAVMTRTFSPRVTVLLVVGFIPEALLSLSRAYYLERKQAALIGWASPIKMTSLLILALVTGPDRLTYLVFAYITISSYLAVVCLFPWSMLREGIFNLREYLWQDLRSAASYLALTATSLVYSQADSLLIRYQLSSQALGIYGSAYRYIDGLNLISNSLYQNLFPVSAKKEGVSWYDLRRLLSIMAGIGFASSISLFVLSPWLTSGLLGSEYAEAESVLRVLSLVLFLFMVNAPLGTVIQSSDLLHRFLPWGVANTLANVLLNLMLLPTYGVLAAAWIMVVSEFVGLCINLVFVRRLYAKAD